MTALLTPVNHDDFAADLSQVAALIDAEMAKILLEKSGGASSKHINTPLHQAMSYAALGGGKKIRGALVLKTSELFSVPRPAALMAAASIEFMHSYSLIHDDLPAMDDGKLRRGKKTVHLEFDEATAILAGDALLTLSFEVIAGLSTSGISSTNVCQLLTALARAAGPEGMVLGQMMDMQMIKIGREKTPLSFEQSQTMQSLKTGKLLEFSCLAGGILGNASEDELKALQKFGEAFGLCFQITDDLLDALSSTERLGKEAGQDVAMGKQGFVHLYGLKKAQEFQQFYYQEGLKALQIFGQKTQYLGDLLHYSIERTR